MTTHKIGNIPIEIGNNDYTRSGETYLIGKCYWKNPNISTKIPLAEFDSTESVEEFADLLKSVTGFFSVITSINNEILVGSDYINGFPIYLVTDGGVQLITDNQSNALQQIKNPTLDQEAILEYNTATFVSGHDTLVKEIKQTIAGGYVRVDCKGNPIFNTYFDFHYGPQSQKTVEEFHNVWTSIINRLIDYADGRQIWIPLTAGYDTRIIISGLVEANYSNIKAFTWGLEDHPESRIAEKVTRSLGVDWHRVTFTQEEFYDWYRTKDRYRLDKLFGLSSIPWLREWVSVRELLSRDLMSEDSVVVNGCSGGMVSGAKIPKKWLKENQIDEDKFYDYILKEHYNHTKINDENQIRKKIASNLGFRGGEPKDAIQTLEQFDWRERQSKLAVSSSRAHMVNGVDWWLPWWDAEIVDFFLTADFEQRVGRKFQKTAVQYIYENVSDDNIPCNPPKSTPEKLARMIHDTGLYRILTSATELLNIDISYDFTKNNYNQKPENIYTSKPADGELGILGLEAFRELYEPGDTILHPFSYRAKAILGEVELPEADHPFGILRSTQSDKPLR